MIQIDKFASQTVATVTDLVVAVQFISGVVEIC